MRYRHMIRNFLYDVTGNEATGQATFLAKGALTASRLIARLRARLSEAPAALQTFEMLLRFIGWDDAA
jgi:hypothetical protein